MYVHYFLFVSEINSYYIHFMFILTVIVRYFIQDIHDTIYTSVQRNYSSMSKCTFLIVISNNYTRGKF